MANFLGDTATANRVMDSLLSGINRRNIKLSIKSVSVAFDETEEDSVLQKLCIDVLYVQNDIDMARALVENHDISTLCGSKLLEKKIAAEITNPWSSVICSDGPWGSITDYADSYHL
jgi:hypothetical protein